MIATALEAQHQQTHHATRTLALTTGITSTIGMAFHRAFEAKQFHAIGFTRGKTIHETHHPAVQLDLLDAAAVQKEIARLPLAQFQQIIWVHSVGAFAFEANGLPATDSDCDGIDDTIFHANVTTTMHMLHALIEHMQQQNIRIPLRFCLFGSTSSDYPTPFWPSFTKSKQLLSALAQMEITRHREMDISGVMAKLSTVQSPSLSCHRELKDVAHFLTADEVVEKTLPHLLFPQTRWRELSLFKPRADFDPSWYWDPIKIRERWTNARKSLDGTTNA